MTNPIPPSLALSNYNQQRRETNTLLYGDPSGEPIDIEFFSERHLKEMERWDVLRRTQYRVFGGDHANHMLNCGGLLLRREGSPEFKHGKYEGYWRNNFVPNGPNDLPWPVLQVSKGFKKKLFLHALIKFEVSLPDECCVLYRGFSVNRLDGTYNGCAEYQVDGWNWPEGFKSYLAAGVLPSGEFARFIAEKVNDPSLVRGVKFPEYK